MIKIETIPLREKNSPKAVMTESELNELLTISRMRIGQVVEGMSCTDHPEADSTIFLLGSMDSMNLTEVYRCCCLKFRDEVRERIRRASSN